jgi:CheY-like chemotaxis protein
MLLASLQQDGNASNRRRMELDAWMDRCIVVVDDEPDVLDLVRQILEEDGMMVIPVDGPARMEKIKHEITASLVLVDLMLPGMTGIELARRLQANSMAGIPMIAMSASRSMLRAADDSHLFRQTLAKPFELSELLDAVEKYTK